MTLELLLQHLVSGISLGSIYAFIAIGYTIVYGILKMVNVAQGSVFMLAGFLAMWGVYRYSLPWQVSLILAAALTVVAGVAIEKVAYRPLRDYKVCSFISATAVAAILQNLVIILFTAVSKPFPQPAILNKTIHLGNVIISSLHLFVMATCVISLFILNYLVTKTRAGRAMRALSEDMETTELMGVDIDQVISFAFALSAAFAAVGAFMWGWAFLSVDPFSGVIPGMKGLIGAVMGGVGSIPGALLGGFLLGLSEVMLVALLPGLSSWRDVFAFSILIVFLLLRPGGLFNVRLTDEKV